LKVGALEHILYKCFRGTTCGTGDGASSGDGSDSGTCSGIGNGTYSAGSGERSLGDRSLGDGDRPLCDCSVGDGDRSLSGRPLCGVFRRLLVSLSAPPFNFKYLDLYFKYFIL
jgi:hypothetical protein